MAAGDFGIFENTFFKIWITHLATQQTINFRGWVNEFSDQFTSTWNTETVYGRMDPLATFQNTQRQISLGFDIVSADAAQAQQNLNRINSLISYLYPVYHESRRSSQNTLKAAPLLGLRWTNLVADPYDGSQLVGYLAGASYAPDLNQGSFFQSGHFVEEGTAAGAMEGPVEPGAVQPGWRQDREGKDAIMIPKVVSMQLEFTVLHKHLTGWAESGTNYTFGDGGKLFPNANNVSVPGASQNRTTVFDSTGVNQDNPVARGAVADITGDVDP
jgi:hypothetical protein